jgi:sn-glycerol 3-phosphate transport system permease protein
MLNSIVVAVIVTIAQVVTSILAAYAFAMLDFPGRNVLFVLFLATLLVPIEATLVVNRRTIDSLGWLNSYQGLTVPFLATAFGTFLMRQVFLTLPRDLRDAAAIDGVGHLGFLRHVAVPLVRPTIAAMAALAFLSTWNQYLWPNLITTNADMYTLQSGLRSLGQARIDQPNLVMAGVIIAFLPIVIVLLVFQRHLVRGLTSGGVKG